ncbi:MAG: TlpA disulfide reductase family protein [Solirubrobacteraceae bacterium]|nr:TlpA disulfide reductase family protein [Solirubrobacteraceae bacterium]
MKIVLSLLAAAALAAGLAACGDDASRPAALTTPPAAPMTSIAPETPAGTRPAASPALARNAARANELVGDGSADLQRRLAALEGQPVVVNLWASWCGPCRHEFPFFAAATERHAATVAFLGIDVMDDRERAEQFVESQPPGFPSIYDGDGEAADSLGSGRRVMPTTFFVGRDGRIAHTKLGGYAKAAELEADIRRYALKR